MKRIISTVEIPGAGGTLYPLKIIAAASCLQIHHLNWYFGDKAPEDLISIREALCAKVYLASVQYFTQREARKIVCSWAGMVERKDGSIHAVSWHRHYRELMERLGETIE